MTAGHDRLLVLPLAALVAVVVFAPPGLSQVPPPAPVVHPSPPALPNLVIDRMSLGPWECLSLTVRNAGLAPKAAGGPVDYQVDANYQNPLNMWTASGRLDDLTRAALDVQESRDTAVCDRRTINAYRSGTIFLTLNPNGTPPGTDRTNNTRSIAVPQLTGPELAVITGTLSMTGPRDYDSVDAIVSVVNMGNQPAVSTYGLTVHIVPRWDVGSPRPFFNEYTASRLFYTDRVNPLEQRVVHLPFPRLLRRTLLPNFFTCVATWAALDVGGDPRWIWIYPPELAGTYNAGGLPVHDPAAAHCWDRFRAPPPAPRQ